MKKAFIDAYRAAQKDRYKIFGSWCFDRWIFTVAMLAIFGWLAFVAWSYDFQLDYFVCNASQGYYELFDGRPGSSCANPFYAPPSWKNVEYLPSGEYGQKPGALFETVYYVPVALLIIAFYINYIIYNKRKGVTK